MVRPSPRSRSLLSAAALASLLVLAGIARADGLHEQQHDVQSRLGEARSQIAGARSQEAQLAADIAAQSDRIQAVEGQAAEYAAQVARLEQELGAARTRLRSLRSQLVRETEWLRAVRRQHSVAQQALARHVVAIYTADRADGIDVVLTAESLGELLDGLELQSRVSRLDHEMVARLRTVGRRVQRARARTASLERQQDEISNRLAAQTSERRAAYQALVSERDRLAGLRAARERSLASVQVERRQWEAEAGALAAESTRVAALIAAAPPPTPSPSISAGSDDTHFATPAVPSTGSGFVWPVRGTVVSPFGQRWGRLHAGVDIAAPAGTPVAASASGTVTYAGWMSGYGYLVVLQHTNGIATAYAHNSSISVSVGQAVAQGQTIAAVGCTGHCFGDHVHFEVRVGGSPVDPMGYL